MTMMTDTEVQEQQEGEATTATQVTAPTVGINDLNHALMMMITIVRDESLEEKHKKRAKSAAKNIHMLLNHLQLEELKSL